MLLFKLFVLLSFLQLSSAEESGRISDQERRQDDLEAFESRYKVDAKPEPYRPPRPAPNLDDDVQVVTTSPRTTPTTRRTSKQPGKKNKPEVIYPTTTYRPVNLYLPTKPGEKVVPSFSKKKHSSESFEIISRDPLNSKKRLRKVKKVFRNNIKHRNKSNEEEEETKEDFSLESDASLPEVKSLLPTVTKKPKLTTIPTQWPDRLLNFPSFAQNDPFGEDEPLASDSQLQPQRQSTSGRDSKLYLPDDSYSNPVRSLPISPKGTKTQPLFQHDGDDEVASLKKSRGLPILSQLSKRPVTTIPLAVPALQPTEQFQPKHFIPEPIIETETLSQIFNPVLPAKPNVETPVIQLPKHVAAVPVEVRSLPPSNHPSSNEIFGSSHTTPDVHDNYDYEQDYEAIKARPYSFTYGVKDDLSGTDFSRAEESSGQVTKGSYQVALPDGRVQIVNYVADVNGFKATVSYEGEAVYPSPDQYGSYVPSAAVSENLATSSPEVTPITPLPNIKPLFQQDSPPRVPLVSEINEDHIYDDYYDEYVPQPVGPIVKSLASRSPKAIITTKPPHSSRTSSTPFASTTKSFLPTYPHFEPLFQENIGESSPEPDGLQQPASPVFSPSTSSHLASTFSNEFVTPSPAPLPSSTTVKSLPPLPGSYSPTTFWPEYEYYGSQRKRQVNNADVYNHQDDNNYSNDAKDQFNDYREFTSYEGLDRSDVLRQEEVQKDENHANDAKDQFNNDYREFTSYEGLDRSDVLRREEAQIVIAENISEDDLEAIYD